ncbi:hypothetical protein PRIPAC_88039 [Pristionchus pacificus]|uniref:Uncharacterized protein n=1 Tax=Pristionchus pacificus TaxID=54126 RepID=A0A2A6CTW2_PRIPA|nr:hypothetical protein PRIPAC_88039 [Pristionchus pacificus]|eukprot:PDM81473.1 hypothetical protein PRIPAC_35349 [Pristionchus pacificus]
MMTSSAVLLNAARQVDYYADFQTQIFTFFEFSVSRSNFRPTKLGQPTMLCVYVSAESSNGTRMRAIRERMLNG